MYSIFLISKSECTTCTNKTLKSLGKLQGIFGAEIDQIEGKIDVSHTDEISKTQIAALLEDLGFKLVDQELEKEENEPSIWGCAL
jgi:copper chaperone CopZ